MTDEQTRQIGAYAPISAPGDDGSETAASLQRLRERLDVVVSEDPDELFERAIEEGNRASRALARQGYYLLAAKALLSHGEFEGACTKRYIPPRRARESMRVTRLLVAAESRPDKMPGAVARRLLDLPPSKLEALARVDPEHIAEIDEKQAWDLLDDIDTMPVEMLRREVRRLRGKTDQQSERIAAQERELDQCRRAAGAPAGSEHPASVTRARSEAAALADQALAVIAAVERQSAVLLEAPDLGETRPERARNIEAAAKPIVLQLAAVLSSASAAYRTARERLGDWLPEGEWSPDDQPLPLTLDELRRLSEWRDVHVRRMEWEAERREAERLGRGEIKRGRGRPRKPPASAPAPRRPRGRPRKAPPIAS